MNPKYSKISEEGLELKDFTHDDEGLLESFQNTADVDNDERLNNNDMTNDSEANEIDRNIHENLRYQLHNEGNSSSSNSGSSSSSSENINDHGSQQPQPVLSNDGHDLENQMPLLRLTPTQRVMNVLNHLIPIKQTYERINNGIMTGRMQSNVPGRFIGQGTDGVFRNLMAKPDVNGMIQKETNPPTYEEAAADATPEYWETSVIAPIYEDEVFVEGLPVGNIANFVWNALVTVAFQFVGFLLCYLLHTSNAAKHGSRAGLGITFIFYGWNLIPSNFGSSDKLPEKYEPKNPNNFKIDKGADISDGGIDDYTSDLYHQSNDDGNNNIPYFAYGLIAFGLLMILKALVDFYRVKQMERVILHPPNNATNTTTTTTTSTEESNWEQPSQLQEEN